MSDSEREFYELQVKVELYEQQYHHYNRKIDTIKDDITVIDKKISKLPCAVHEVSIDNVKKAVDNISGKINGIFYTILGAIFLMVLVWGYKEIFQEVNIKNLISKEISKLSYAAELYENK